MMRTNFLGCSKNSSASNKHCVFGFRSQKLRRLFEWLEYLAVTYDSCNCSNTVFIALTNSVIYEEPALSS